MVTLTFRRLFDRTTMTATMMMITHGQIVNRVVLIKDVLTITPRKLTPVYGDQSVLYRYHAY